MRNGSDGSGGGGGGGGIEGVERVFATDVFAWMHSCLLHGLDVSALFVFVRLDRCTSDFCGTKSAWGVWGGSCCWYCERPYD